MGNRDLIGSVEACELLGGIERSTLIRRIAAGRLSAVKMPGERGPYVFERAEVLRHKAEVDAARARREAARAAS